MIVVCSLCNQEMEIDSPCGIEYVKEIDETIHHVICSEQSEEPVELDNPLAPEGEL